ncbi:unnamed protein product [Arctia plantaginis]|uniref:Amino acid transporter transmembrane domain-containing protein n=1 Tax=Arctia plantaginis TaxID=874455 RepID=A0A8S1BIN1_ARCPL|nr:unnamed protein product [Arctia plantaginis]
MGTTGLSITLANSIIGVGILAMPFCFQQCGLLLGGLILLSMGFMSRLCCYFLLKSALLARRRNFEFLAFHVFGSAGKMAVELGIIGFLMGTCIAYFVVVGDLGPQIIAKMFNINQSDILRTSIMVIVSLVCVLPLGLLRNVDSLSNVSAATICFYVCLVMKVITEAASQLMTSDWHRRVEMWRPAGLLQCVPIISMALFCQTQLFEIFESLPTLSLEKMNLVTKNAINICTVVYFTLGVFGYIAFSSHDISGNILMSLSPTMASDVIKLGFVMSVAFSFPLIIFPCRASLYSFLYKKVHSSHHDHIINHSIPETTFRCITVAIIAVSLFVSVLIPNIELVLGLVGSTIGVLICVVFPAACFVHVTYKNTNERLLAKGILFLGLIIMVLGTYANLEAAGENSKVDRYDEKYTQEKIDKIVEDFFEKRDKDGVYLKQEPVLPIEINNNIPLNNDKKKDSEIQPPNPVPPESQSNEKMAAKKVEVHNYEEKKVEPLPVMKETLKRSSQTHPKNLKNKFDLKINGVDTTEPEKAAEVQPQSNEEKNDMLKQQKLIETIKQHGEEQKELMKEQKEILDEIIKTKKELEQNKNGADTNEAKKIAMESIKQIASMAIQSIGGVSEKPVQIDEKKEERLEKLTNEAVQEIAKKAVETIEAIKEIKENPAPLKIADASIQNGLPAKLQSNQNPQQPVNSLNVNPPINLQNDQHQINSQDNLKNIKPRAVSPTSNQQQGAAPVNVQREIINSENVQPQVINYPNIQHQAVNSQVPQNLNNPQTLANIVNPPVYVPQNNIPPANIEKDKPINSKPGQIQNNAPINPQTNKESKAAGEAAQLSKVQIPAQTQNKDTLHSHSPDEPQSYKQGEDAQVKNPEAKVHKAVPLPIAMNDLLSSKQIQEKEAVGRQLNEDIQVIVPQKVESNDNIQPNVVRQKREVVDCTQKVELEPKDREICNTLVDRPKEKDRMPPVDLHDMLPKSLVMDTNMLNIGRSLKSYEGDER